MTALNKLRQTILALLKQEKLLAEEQERLYRKRMRLLRKLQKHCPHRKWIIVDGPLILWTDGVYNAYDLNDEGPHKVCAFCQTRAQVRIEVRPKRRSR